MFNHYFINFRHAYSLQMLGLGTSLISPPLYSILRRAGKRPPLSKCDEFAGSRKCSDTCIPVFPFSFLLLEQLRRCFSCFGREFAISSPSPVPFLYPPLAGVQPKFILGVQFYSELARQPFGNLTHLFCKPVSLESSSFSLQSKNLRGRKILRLECVLLVLQDVSKNSDQPTV